MTFLHFFLKEKTSLLERYVRDMLSRVELKHVNYIRIDICAFKLSENVKNIYIFGLRFLYIEDITWPHGDTEFLFEC